MTFRFSEAGLGEIRLRPHSQSGLFQPPLLHSGNRTQLVGKKTIIQRLAPQRQTKGNFLVNLTVRDSCPAN